MSSWLGYRNIDDLLTFAVNTHSASTGAATDADAVPSYRVYEDETGTAILTGSMAKLDDTNTTGFYSEQLTLSAANGFEAGKCYSVYISAAVSSVTGTTERHFSIWPTAINSTIGADIVKISGDSVAADNLESYTDGTTAMPVNVTQISGDATAADNLEAATDGTGYNVGGGSIIVDSVTNNVGGNVTGSVGSVTGNVGGNVAGSVNSVTTGVSLAAGAIDANAVATSAVDEIVDAVWEEPRNDHKTGSTMGASLEAIRKANFITEGTVNSTTGATTTSFRTNLTAVNDAYQHQTILFVNSAALNGQSAPILSYAQTNGVITLGDALTVAPSLNDEFVILPTHVYPMPYIVTNILEGNTSTTSYAAGDVGNILARLHNMIEADGADFRYTTNALEQAPSGGGGGGGWALNADQTTGLKRVISAIVGVGGETATPGVLEFDMVGETTTLRITQSTDGNDRLTVEEV